MRHRDAHVLIGIYRGVVDAHFVVKVGSSGASAGADVADCVTALHMLPRGDGKTGKVAVTCADTVAVIDDQGIRIRRLPIGGT